MSKNTNIFPLFRSSWSIICNMYAKKILIDNNIKLARYILYVLNYYYYNVIQILIKRRVNLDYFSGRLGTDSQVSRHKFNFQKSPDRLLRIIVIPLINSFIHK